MEWFWNNFGTVLTISSFLVGGVGFVLTIRHDLQTIDKRMVQFEGEIRELRKVMVDLAKQEARLNSVDQSLVDVSKRIDLNNLRIDRMMQKYYDEEIKQTSRSS
jgi:hypothetical protein